MGRNIISLTEAQKAEVETLASVLSAEQIADFFAISRRTFYSMMARDEEIAARYKRGKAKAIGAIAQGLINKARGGDTASMIFFLKTQAGWRETTHIEHTLPDPSRLLDLSNLSDQTLEEMMAALDRATAAEQEEDRLLEMMPGISHAIR